MEARRSSQAKPAPTGHSVADPENGVIAPGRLPRAAMLTIIVTAVADLVVYFVARALWGVPGEYAAFFNPIAIVAAAVMSVVVATIGLAILARLTRRPLRIFIPVAVVVTLLSLAGPLQALGGMMPGMPPATIATAMAMVAMHFITGGVIAGLLPARAA